MVRRRVDASALVTCVPCIAGQAGVTPTRYSGPLHAGSRPLFGPPLIGNVSPEIELISPTTQSYKKRLLRSV